MPYKDPEKRRAAQREASRRYAKRHRDKINAKARSKYRAILKKSRAYQREWYNKNREKRLEQNWTSRQRNKENRRRYYQENRESILKKQREYYHRKNPSKGPGRRGRNGIVFKSGPEYGDPYRSGFERKIAHELEEQGVEFQYEPIVVPFTQPAKERRYVPDLVLPNGIVLELKGEFKTANRQQMQHVMDCHPELDLRFIFGNASLKIGKRSRTRYRDYCDQRGWLWAEGTVPEAWINEPPKQASLAAIRRLQRRP